ncbi:hypothetical protein NHQ30_011571 [Ciborinia camelliae]|nr:hypothetical protein NHQ30_011571 [Ciborinia camelliae]
MSTATSGTQLHECSHPRCSKKYATNYGFSEDDLVAHQFNQHNQGGRLYKARIAHEKKTKLAAQVSTQGLAQERALKIAADHEAKLDTMANDARKTGGQQVSASASASTSQGQQASAYHSNYGTMDFGHVARRHLASLNPYNQDASDGSDASDLDNNQRSIAQNKTERDSDYLGDDMSASMDGLNAQKATTPTQSASSHSVAVEDTRNRDLLPRPYNQPQIPLPRHVASTGASIARPSTTVSATSSGNSSIPPTRRPVNTQRAEGTASIVTRPSMRRTNLPPPALGRARESSRLSPPPARNHRSANLSASANSILARNASASSASMTGASRTPGPHFSDPNYTKLKSKFQARQAKSSSLGSSSLDSDDDYDDDDDKEEGLFVSPSDADRNQAAGTGSGSRVLGVRGFANLPLPRDQDSDEEDLRPSHVLKQERRAAAAAAAGKPARPDNARDRFGRLYTADGHDRTMSLGHMHGARVSLGNLGKAEKPKKVGKVTARSASARTSDSDDDFHDSGMSSSGDSFEGTSGPGRRSTHQDNRGLSTDPRRSSATNAAPPRTPSPQTEYFPYQVYGPDLLSPPPSYLIKSPGVIDRRLPYVDRSDDSFLPDAATVKTGDLFDADDVHFTFKGPSARDIEVQKRLDAEKEAMRANAYGSGFRAPMHFDTCPYTAPINRSERAAWIAERLRLDAEERRGDGFEDVERLLGMDRDVNRHTAANAAAGMTQGPGSSAAAGSKGKKATCAGPARVKRKYIWKDQEMKNKRRRGGVAAGRLLVGGAAQIDGTDERAGARAGPGAMAPNLVPRAPAPSVVAGGVAGVGLAETAVVAGGGRVTTTVALEHNNSTRAFPRRASF